MGRSLGSSTQHDLMIVYTSSGQCSVLSSRLPLLMKLITSLTGYSRWGKGMQGSEVCCRCICSTSDKRDYYTVQAVNTSSMIYACATPHVQTQARFLSRFSTQFSALQFSVCLLLHH